MGLDVYAMPLTRRWSGCWESVMVRFSRRLTGRPCSTIRVHDGKSQVIQYPIEEPEFPKSWSAYIRGCADVMTAFREKTGAGPDAVPPPVDVYELLFHILRSIGRTPDEGTPWDEENWARFAGEQLGWEPLNVLLAYAATPGAGSGSPVPPERVKPFECPPLEQCTCSGLRFVHVSMVGAHLGTWLPIDAEQVFALEGKESGAGDCGWMVFGATRRLLAELDEINRDWGLTRDWMQLTSGESIAPADDPHADAKTGWAILRGIARESLALDCPMFLDG